MRRYAVALAVMLLLWTAAGGGPLLIPGLPVPGALGEEAGPVVRGESDPADTVILEVSGTAVCTDYNHVGNEWNNRLYLNGEEVDGTAGITVGNGDLITVTWVIEEGNEKYPDSERFTEEILITPEILMNGYILESKVVVTESNGRYAGNSAVWHVTVTLSPAGDTSSSIP